MTARVDGPRAPWLLAALIVLPGACVAPAAAQGQTAEQLSLLRVEATPIGALPPLAMPMPASRNSNYWGARVQLGHRRGRGGPDLLSIAGGIDYQLRGGSILGVTAGFQERDCDIVDGECAGHTLWGVRGRFNIITSGPSLGEAFNDYSATVTIASETGFGYAPSVTDGVNACTFDIGLPLSIAFLQRIRIVPFVTPSVVWDVDCSKEGPPASVRWMASFGIGFQQLGMRGLDAYLGVQRIFAEDTGYHFGLSVTYIRLR